MSLSMSLVSTSTQPPLFSEKSACKSNKMARPPPLEPIVTIGPRDLNLTVVRDHSPTATPAASTDIPKSPQTAPLLESSRQSSQSYVSSPSRRRLASRRQSSISYLPADSPRLWTPRTPHLGLDTFEHASLSSPNSGKRPGHVRTVSVPQRAALEKPMGLTLAERCVPSFLFSQTLIYGGEKTPYKRNQACGTPPVHRPEGVQVSRAPFSAHDTRV